MNTVIFITLFSVIVIAVIYGLACLTSPQSGRMNLDMEMMEKNAERMQEEKQNKINE